MLKGFFSRICVWGGFQQKLCLEGVLAEVVFGTIFDLAVKFLKCPRTYIFLLLTIIKSLLIPKFVDILSLLPAPKAIVQELNRKKPIK